MYTIHCVKRQYNLLPRILARSTLHYSGRICFLKILKNVPAGQCSLWKDHKAVFREFLPVARCIVWVGRVFLKNLKVHPLLYVTCTIHTNNHLSFFTNVQKIKSWLSNFCQSHVASSGSGVFLLVALAAVVGGGMLAIVHGVPANITGTPNTSKEATHVN